jgi:hypothetical protein
MARSLIRNEARSMMGFEKLPHSSQLMEFGMRRAVQSWTQFLDSRKGPPPTSGGIAPETLRKVFPHTYSAYVMALGGWLRSKETQSDLIGMERTFLLLAQLNPLAHWQTKRWVFGKHHACLVYPGQPKQAEFDELRRKLNLPARTDLYHDSYIFDPWIEKTPAVYQSQTWCQSLRGNGLQVEGQEYKP